MADFVHAIVILSKFLQWPSVYVYLMQLNKQLFIESFNKW